MASDELHDYEEQLTTAEVENFDIEHRRRKGVN
jgi:hypothetical protein